MLNCLLCYSYALLTAFPCHVSSNVKPIAHSWYFGTTSDGKGGDINLYLKYFGLLAWSCFTPSMTCKQGPLYPCTPFDMLIGKSVVLPSHVRTNVAASLYISLMRVMYLVGTISPRPTTWHFSVLCHMSSQGQWRLCASPFSAPYISPSIVVLRKSPPWLTFQAWTQIGFGSHLSLFLGDAR